VFITPLSRAGPYSLVAAKCAYWIMARVSIMATKAPKKFSVRKGPLKSAQNDEELKNEQHYEQGGEE